MTPVLCDPSVRDMVVADLGVVLAIDQEVYPRPWSPSFLRQQLASPETRVNRVAEVDGRVVGHAGLMMVADQGHVTTLAVHPDVQGFGIGTRLMADLCRAAVERRLDTMTLEVRVSNLRARELYRRFGFIPAGAQSGYYSVTGEDALFMQVDDLTGHAFMARVEAASGTEAQTGGGSGSG